MTPKDEETLKKLHKSGKYGEEDIELLRIIHFLKTLTEGQQTAALQIAMGTVTGYEAKHRKKRRTAIRFRRCEA